MNTRLPTAPMNGTYIISGEKINIRPMTTQSRPDRHLPPGRFPTLLELEEEYVRKVLEHVHGNKSKAAEVLGINRVSLWRMLKRMKARASHPART